MAARHNASWLRCRTMMFKQVHPKRDQGLMMKVLSLVLAIVSISNSEANAADQTSTATGQTSVQVRAERAWKELTEADVKAAHQLLIDNHPAALPETNDPAFTQNMNNGYVKAMSRAQSVKSLDGYSATLREYANSMGDGHIWSHPTFSEDSINWAGIIIAKRGAAWIVAREDKGLVGTDIVGAALESCDGRDASRLSRETLSFWTVKGDSAMQTMRASRLLMDDGNPFLNRPQSCKFRLRGNIKSVDLKWQDANRDDLSKTFWKPVPGSAGFGVRQVGKGYWIALESLDSRAQAVIDSTNASANAIRGADYVVVDMRGNFGGNDQYGRKLANALYGTQYVAARLGPVTSDCPSVFRSSPENIAAMRKQLQVFEKSGDHDGAIMYASGIKSMEKSRSIGKGLTGPITCNVEHRTGGAASPSMIRAPIYILTDVGCFSSCINTVGYFRQLGAIQVGQPTGADTHYSEVREITLPSGLSTFSTMMALMPDAPAHIGPFIPVISYDGDISNTASLEAWFPAHALRQ